MFCSRLRPEFCLSLQSRRSYPLRPRSLDSQPLRGHSVLIVDDEESIREIVEDGLSVRGMKVASAESAEAALAYLATHSPEVVICDFNLPGMTGEQLFEQVRSRSGSCDAAVRLYYG